MSPQEANPMLYYRPGGNRFVGDCMPFQHDGVFHLLYLLDEGHHQARGGLGGHQWAHASTPDLVHWTHHPLALAIEHDWEGSICTGSVYIHEGTCHAFFATRMPDLTQHLGRAVSTDGVHFTRCAPNPFFSPPPGYSPCDCRDPFVFWGGDGRFHLLATACRIDPPLHDRGGCLLHLTSDDLAAWTLEEEPFFVPGEGRGYRSVPECPDYFAWNGWWYLLYGLGLATHYRMARHPLGPWERPRVDVLDSPKLAVMKTAPFGANRRIGAGWLGCRQDDRDDGALLWGGNLVLREIVQHADGTLGTRFVPELCRPTGERVPLDIRPLTERARVEGTAVRLDARTAPQAAVLEDVPEDCRVRVRVAPGSGCGRFGLGLRGSGRLERMVELGFDPGLQKAWLADEGIEGVEFLTEPFDLEVACRGDILDACLSGRRCLLNRLPEAHGRSLFLWAAHGEAAFERLEITAL